MKLQNPLWLKVVTLITFLIMITVNALANIIPIGGVNTGEVSAYYDNLFTPAPITFSIWGVIYILLTVFTLFQFGVLNNTQDESKAKLIARTSKYFSATSLLNAAWIFAWHYNIIWLSLVMMSLIMTILIIISLEFKKYEYTKREKVLMRLPFSVYFGWITIATIANIVVFFVSLGWGGFGLPQEYWTIIVLVTATGMGIAAVFNYRDYIYGLVLIWSYAGILIKHLSSYGYYREYPSVIITVGLCIVLMTAVVISEMNHEFKSRKQQ